MKKTIINVPKGIRFITQWKDYDIMNFNFPHILNKKLTGCGFTEYSLRNQYDTILCSPRKVLLENKESQHKDIFYFKNDITKDLCRKTKKTPEQLFKELQKRFQDYCKQRRANKLPCKILVTYDSFCHIKSLLGSSINSFSIVVDEFQSIFMDAAFKPDTELHLLTHLQGLQNVCFVSATPILEKYLDMLDEFKNLPYFEFDWISEDPGRVLPSGITTIFCSDVLASAKSVMRKYLEQGCDPEKYIYHDNSGKLRIGYSKEAVLYFNSVTSICTLISYFKLRPDQVNILCADTEINKKKLRKAFKLRKNLLPNPIGSIPKKGDPHKMFTLCTSTVYLGADFYSTCAKTFVFSDANIDCLMVDIQIDLDQILGRQRLDENPWHGRATLYVKTTQQSITPVEFKKHVDNKIQSTNLLISAYHNLSLLERTAVVRKYSESVTYMSDYLSVNTIASGELRPAFNNLVLTSELRAFEVQQGSYRNCVTVQNGVQRLSYSPQTVFDANSSFIQLALFKDQIGFLMNFRKIAGEENFRVLLHIVPLKFSSYLLNLTEKEIVECKYSESSMLSLLDSRIINGSAQSAVDSEVLAYFTVGNVYSLVNIKQKLLEIYTKYNYKIGARNTLVAKASDLENWFNLRNVRTKNLVSEKREFGYEILSVK